MPLVIRLAEILEVICITLAFGFQFIVIFLHMESQKDANFVQNNIKTQISNNNNIQAVAKEESPKIKNKPTKIKKSKKTSEAVKQEKYIQMVREPKTDTLLYNSYNLTKSFHIYQGIPIILSIIFGSIVRRYFKTK